MSDELRLGFYRLSARLEDPVNLGVGIALIWMICAWLIGVVFAMSFLQVLLLAAVGIAVVLILRGKIAKVSLRMRQSHERLERRDTAAA